MIVSLDIDAQKTFTPLCPEELPVSGGDQIAAELNAQAALADLRVMSKDAHSMAAHWRCADHADQLQPTGLPNAPETWVAHAVVGTDGFTLLDTLPAPAQYDFCVWKGVEPDMHPYGACYHDIAETLSTGLIEWLRDKQADTLIVGGLATDYCVKATVLQLLHCRNWRVVVNRAACRGIATDTEAAAWREMQQQGALVLQNAAAIADWLKNRK